MSSESHSSGGHNAPLSNDLPPTPTDWHPIYTPFRNDYVERHIDWVVTPPERLGPPSMENRKIADALAKRARAETKARKQRA